MSGASAQRRRWLSRYGLRTLFVSVTIAALPSAWLGYHMNWIRERHKAERDIDNHLTGCCIMDFNNVESKDLPWSLRVLGEPPHYGFTYTRRDAKENLEAFHRRAKELESLFPESKVYVSARVFLNSLQAESDHEPTSNLTR